MGEPGELFRDVPKEGACKACGRRRDVEVDIGHLCLDCRQIRNTTQLSLGRDLETVTCRACRKRLLVGNDTIADGCPCNSGRGVNHGVVRPEVCTCVVCDPAQTGSSRVRKRLAPVVRPAGDNTQVVRSSDSGSETVRPKENEIMASNARLLGLAEGWLMRVNHMTTKELSERLLHGEVESLAALLREVRDEAQGRDVRLLEEALERGRETLHKAIADRADMQTKLAQASNYTADTQQAPHKITFANGRVVRVLADGSLDVGWSSDAGMCEGGGPVPGSGS
jgi:hypothetical protein